LLLGVNKFLDFPLGGRLPAGVGGGTTGGGLHGVLGVEDNGGVGEGFGFRASVLAIDTPAATAAGLAKRARRAKFRRTFRAI
jgi:hypothetical protein